MVKLDSIRNKKIVSSAYVNIIVVLVVIIIVAVVVVVVVAVREIGPVEALKQQQYQLQGHL